MEKIKVNNQIVLMRKYVKQAKVRAINKLTKEVKLLQDRKGNEMQVAKAKRKAERFLEEITLLKKIKPDYVSKLALSKTTDWNEVLEQKKSSLNDRCIAVLASYKAVQNEVQCFYSSNPYIVPKIPDLIKEWEQKSKLIKGLPRDKKAADGKRGRIDKNMKKMYSKNKIDSSSSVSDQQIDKINNVLSEKQESLDLMQNDNKDVSQEENDDSFQETEDENNSSLVNSQEHKKQKKVRKQVLKLSSVESQNEISDVEPVENSESDENLIEEESNESYSNDESSTKHPLKELADHSNDKISEDSASVCGETPGVESKTNQSKSNKRKSLPIKDVSSDSHKKKNNKRKLSGDEKPNSSPMKSNCIQSSDFFLNHKKPSKKDLKAIALINLNELEDLDEIPLNKTVEDKNEESDEDEQKMLSEKKIDDPFFLGSEELNNTNDDILRDESKNRPFLSKYGHRNDRERDMSFNRREKSFSPNNFKRNFQKPSSYSAFTRNESSRFNCDRNKPFKRDQFQSEHHRGRFQSKEKYGFKKDEIYSKGRKDNNRKERTFHNLERKSQERHSDKLYVRNESSDSFRKDKAMSRKGNDADGKPIHPSWEAKKKQKELAQTGFQGKRMVFSE